MADILMDTQAAYSGTPTGGKGAVFIDSTSKRLTWKDDTGRYWAPGARNWSTANDPSAFASDLYVVGSNILIPSFGLQVGSRYYLRVSASKTAACTGTPAYTIRIGSSGVVGDTSRLALTGPAQTAVIDIGTLNILAVVRAVGAATGVIQATAWWNHRGTAANTTTSGTGFANDSTGHVEATSAAYDNTTEGGKYIGVSINGTSTTAPAAWTVTLVDAQLDI